MRTGPVLALALTVGVATVLREPSTAAQADADPPRLLSATGLYAAGGTSTIDPQNRPYSPQYPLWSDGSGKSRWVRLPAGGTIDATRDSWDFPVGTTFWKEFAFGGRKVETRLLWRGTDDWVFASYVWNEAQSDAVLAPDDGVPNVVEIAPGLRHSIPSIADCRACHTPGTNTRVLGFTALQLSTDRDPNAIHGEPPGPGAVTLRMLVEEGRLRPAHKEWIAAPPRIPGTPRARAVLGYLSGNCSHCHNGEGALAWVGLQMEQSSAPAPAKGLATLLRTGRWQLPTTPAGSAIVKPGAPELSTLLFRMRSRRPNAQMPPIGTVIEDREAVAAVTAWIEEDLAGLPLPR